MDFEDVVRRRRMVRRYDPDRPVPPDVLDHLMRLAIRAPSAGFSQGWGFLVLTGAADRDRFWAATTDPALTGECSPTPETGSGCAPAGNPPDSWLTGMRQAPVLVAVHSNKDIYLDRYAAADKGWTDRDEARWPVPYWDIDAGFASMLILLGAVDAGLGACFFGIPPEKMATYRSAFDVPEVYTAIGVISLGYPAAEDYRSKSLKRGRRPVDEVVHHGRWGES